MAASTFPAPGLPSALRRPGSCRAGPRTRTGSKPFAVCTASTASIIDTHTADGLKVGLEHREAGIPLVCLETALPAKFAATIREALGREPEVPPGFEGLERMPQRVEVIDPSVEAVKAFVARHCHA